jgi:drug/metabolite transporter superfamily protein YnfA
LFLATVLVIVNDGHLDLQGSFEWKAAVSIGGLVTETFLSGVSTIYTQRLFDGSIELMWKRNVQMSIFGMVMFAIMASKNSSCDRWPASYDIGRAACGASGGILVALSLAHAKAVEKCIATSVSVISIVLIESFLWSKNESSSELILLSFVIVLVVYQYQLLKTSESFGPPTSEDHQFLLPQVRK